MSYGYTGFDAMNQPVFHPPAPPPRPPKGPGIGITGLVLCFLAGIGHVVLAYFSADWFALAVLSSSPESETAELGYRIIGTVIGQCGLGVINLVGIILSIVALATGRGRIAGLIGLLIGVLAPVAAFFYFGYASGVLNS